MSAELLFGLGAPLATVLVIIRWLLNFFSNGPPKGACGCGHTFAFHDLSEGTCGGKRSALKEGYATLYESYPCGCKQFTGSMA